MYSALRLQSEYPIGLCLVQSLGWTGMRKSSFTPYRILCRLSFSKPRRTKLNQIGQTGYKCTPLYSTIRISNQFVSLVKSGVDWKNAAVWHYIYHTYICLQVSIHHSHGITTAFPAQQGKQAVKLLLCTIYTQCHFFLYIILTVSFLFNIIIQQSHTLDENLNFLIQDKCSTAGVSYTFPKTHHTSCSQDRAKFPVHFPELFRHLS